tara:strand:+ start:65 stop:265 length:201 start_codon:yes stop_codon:yes gene_type:complete
MLHNLAAANFGNENLVEAKLAVNGIGLPLYCRNSSKVDEGKSGVRATTDSGIIASSGSRIIASRAF